MRHSQEVRGRVDNSNRREGNSEPVVPVRPQREIRNIGGKLNKATLESPHNTTEKNTARTTQHQRPIMSVMLD